MSNLCVLIIAAFMAAARFAFSAAAVRWLAFGCACLIVITVAGAFLVWGRGPVQRGLDLCQAVTAGWTIVASLTFGAETVGWLAVGAGGVCGALAIAGLISHEIVMERGVRPRGGAPSRDGEGTELAARAAPVTMAGWPR